MATCNVNTLLASGKCFAALTSPLIVSGELWCEFSGGGPTPPPSEGITNPDAGDAVITNPDAGDAPITNPEV